MNSSELYFLVSREIDRYAGILSGEPLFHYKL